MRVAFALVGVAAWAALAIADPLAGGIPPPNSVPPGCGTEGLSLTFSGGSWLCTTSSAVLPGTYTVATLPSAASNKAKYAFVSDLGGGADMVLSDGVNWKHIRQGVPASAAAASSVTVTPLASAPIQLITGNLTVAMLVSIASANLYPGYTLTVRFPGALSLAGSLNVGVAGGPSIPLLGGSWGDFIVDSNLVLQKVRGGQL